MSSDGGSMKSHRFHFEKSDRVRFVKFALTGGLNTLVDLAVFALLTMTFSINVYLAQVVSYGAGMLNSYTVTRSWTFHTDKGYLSPQLLNFAAANIFVMTIGMGGSILYTGRWVIPSFGPNCARGGYRCRWDLRSTVCGYPLDSREDAPWARIPSSNIAPTASAPRVFCGGTALSRHRAARNRGQIAAKRRRQSQGQLVRYFTGRALYPGRFTSAPYERAISLTATRCESADSDARREIGRLAGLVKRAGLYPDPAFGLFLRAAGQVELGLCRGRSSMTKGRQPKVGRGPGKSTGGQGTQHPLAYFKYGGVLVSTGI